MGRCGSLVFVHPLYATIETCSDRAIVVTTYLGVIISDDALASAKRRTGRGDASALPEISDFGPLQASRHADTVSEEQGAPPRVCAVARKGAMQLRRCPVAIPDCPGSP